MPIQIEAGNAILAPGLKFSITGKLISSPLDVVQLVQTKHTEDALPEGLCQGYFMLSFGCMPQSFAAGLLPLKVLLCCLPELLLVGSVNCKPPEDACTAQRAR